MLIEQFDSVTILKSYIFLNFNALICNLINQAMKKYILVLSALLIIILSLTACRQNKTSSNQAVNEDAFLGEWYTVRGDVEAYSFLRDNGSFIFTGTQGMRPVIYGTWKIDEDKFVITMDNGTTTAYSFELMNDTLYFNKGLEIYTRTVPLEVQFPETRILKNLISDLGLKFSEPKLSDLTWGTWTDSTQSANDFTLKGYSISLGSTLSSDDLKLISGYLTDCGFERDTMLMTEICNGYWNDNQIVTVCTSQDPEALNDSIYIHVTSGIVPR